MEKRTEKSEERVEEMSKDEKRKLYLDEFHNIKGMDTETYRKMGSTYKIKKLDLSKDTEKFNAFDTDSLMLKNNVIKTIIHDFYKKEYKYFVSVGVDELLSDESTADEGYRFIMYQLEQHLAQKDEFKGLSFSENDLFYILLKNSSEQHEYVYSDKLVNEFKNVLKGMK